LLTQKFPKMPVKLSYMIDQPVNDQNLHTEKKENTVPAKTFFDFIFQYLEIMGESSVLLYL